MKSYDQIQSGSHEFSEIFRIVIENQSFQPMEITVESDIPIGAGLGSSASLALSLTAAVYDFNGIECIDLLVRAQRIENIFHGKDGSGLDVVISM